MQLHVRGPVRADLDDRGGRAREGALERPPQAGQVLDGLVLEAVESRGAGEVEAGRGRDVRRVDVPGPCARAARDREEVEDAPAAVVEQDDRQLESEAGSRPEAARCRARRPRLRSAPRPVRSSRRAAPKALEIVPSTPFAPRLAEHPRGCLERGPEALDVPYGHRGGHEQRARARQQPAELGRDRRLGQAAGGELLGDRSGRSLVGRGPALQPARGSARRARTRGSAASMLRVLAGSRANDQDSTAPGSCQASSGSSPTCVAPSRPASHSRRGREVGRSPTLRTRSGRWSRAKASSRSRAS